MTAFFAFVGVALALISAFVAGWALFAIKDDDTRWLEPAAVAFVGIAPTITIGLFWQSFIANPSPLYVLGLCAYYAVYIYAVGKWRPLFIAAKQAAPTPPTEPPKKDDRKEHEFINDTFKGTHWNNVSHELLNLGVPLTDILKAHATVEALPKTTGIYHERFHLSKLEGDTLMRIIKDMGIPLQRQSVLDLPHLYFDNTIKRLMETTPQYADIAQTPFLRLLEVFQKNGTIPLEPRFEHTWILAPQGTGKTQLMGYLIAEDIKAGHSVVVIDSQGDLTKKVATLREVQDRITLVEPGKVALNPFSFKGDHAVDLLTFVFASLGDGAEMTPLQQTVYRYGIRLMQQIPHATLYTFMDLLNGGVGPYEQYLENLPTPAQMFFRNQYEDNKLLGQTRQQVAWRLSLLLENSAFERMFCAPTTKLDVADILNRGGILVVDTSKQELGKDRSAIFGRFFIALIILAAYGRASIDLNRRHPAFVYIDEAQEYLQDDQVTELLDQARKMRIGMVLANQRSAQISNSNMLDALLTTSVKFVHTDNDHDTNTLARTMKTSAERIASLEKGKFGLFIRNHTEYMTTVDLPMLTLENMEHVPLHQVQAAMARYAPDLPRYEAKSSEAVEEPSTPAKPSPRGDMTATEW